MPHLQQTNKQANKQESYYRHQPLLISRSFSTSFWIITQLFFIRSVFLHRVIIHYNFWARNQLTVLWQCKAWQSVKDCLCSLHVLLNPWCKLNCKAYGKLTLLMMTLFFPIFYLHKLHRLEIISLSYDTSWFTDYWTSTFVHFCLFWGSVGRCLITEMFVSPSGLFRLN